MATTTTTKTTNSSGRSTQTTNVSARTRGIASDKKMTKKEKQDPLGFRTRLKIFPRYRWKIFFACSLGFTVFTSIIFTNLTIQASWTVLIMPIASIGALFLLMPASEEWEYKPWQNASRKIEQSIFDQ